MWRCSCEEGGVEFPPGGYAVFRNGDKVMDGSVDVWVLAVPLPPWTAAHIAVDSGVRTTEQYLATTRRRVGWTPGFEGWRRRAAPRRQTCSRWAGPSLRCGTSASLRCVTSAPRQSAQRLRRLRRRWTRSWRRSRRALEELT